jgi:hypothetical protein
MGRAASRTPRTLSHDPGRSCLLRLLGTSGSQAARLSPNTKPPGSASIRIPLRVRPCVERVGCRSSRGLLGQVAPGRVKLHPDARDAVDARWYGRGTGVRGEKRSRRSRCRPPYPLPLEVAPRALAFPFWAMDERSDAREVRKDRPGGEPNARARGCCNATRPLMNLRHAVSAR